MVDRMSQAHVRLSTNTRHFSRLEEASFFFFRNENKAPHTVSLHTFTERLRHFDFLVLQQTASTMAIFGFRRLLKNLFCFCTLGLDEERAPPATPVRVERRLRSSQWDTEGIRAGESLAPLLNGVKSFGMVARTRSEAARGVCNVIYPE